MRYNMWDKLRGVKGKIIHPPGDILTTLTVLDADVNPVIRYSVIQVGLLAAIFHYIDIHLEMYYNYFYLYF